MAVSTSAMTMAQYAILSNVPRIQAVTFSLIDNGSIMARDVPFANKKSLTAMGARWEGNLPSVTWANLNEEPTVVNGTPKQYTEQAYIVRNALETDHLLLEEENQITSPHAIRVEAYLKSWAYDFNDKFFNNNHVSGDAKSIAGIRARLDDYTTYGVRSGNKIDGAGVVMTASATAANLASFCELMDELLWSVGSPTGEGVIIYLNDQLMRRIDRLARQYAGQGGFSQTTDQLGRVVNSYKAAQLRDPGFKADQTSRIITSTETAAGADGASNFTSLYAVNYGSEGLMGWQFGPMSVTDVPQDNGMIKKTFFEWCGGLFPRSHRAIGRLFNVKYS